MLLAGELLGVGGTGAAGNSENDAETSRAWLIRTVHVAEVPEQAPPQEEKTHPGSGVPVSVTDCPGAYEDAHDAPHVMNPSESAIVPRPETEEIAKSPHECLVADDEEEDAERPTFELVRTSHV